MSGRLFGTTSDYARFGGTMPLTATPFTMLVAAQSSSFAAQQVAMCIANSASVQNWNIGLNITTGAGQFSSHVASAATATSTNTATLNTPFVLIGRSTSITSRTAILNGNIASAGSNATSSAPASVNRITFGKRDTTANDLPWVGVVFYAALWNVALTDDECIALGLYRAPPPLIRPTSLLSYWPLFGRSNGTTIIDVSGRVPLTITGGSDSTAAVSRVMARAPLIGRKSGAAAAVTGTGAGTITALVGAGAGVHGVAGTAAGTINPLVGAAAGVHGVAGTAAGVRNALTGAASANHVPYIGTAAGIRSPLTGAATGVHSVAGTAAGAIVQLTGSASASHVPYIGTAAGIVAPLTGASSAVHGVAGSAAGAIAPLVGNGVGNHGAAAHTGTGAGTINPLVGAATATHVPYLGAAAGSIAALVGAGAGAHGVAGAAAGTRSPLVGAAVATHVPFIGTAAGSIAPLIGDASGTHGVTVDVEFLLENGDQLLLESGQPLLVEAEAVAVTGDGDFLLENGDQLLLESGDQLLLEAGVEAVTNLVAIGAATNTATTASYTPTAGALLLGFVGASHASGAPAKPTLSDTASLAWTEIGDVTNGTVRETLYWATAESSPAARTATVASTGASSVAVRIVQVMAGWQIRSIAGVPNLGTTTDNSGDPTAYLDVSANSGNYVVGGAFFLGVNDVTAGVDYTELGETTAGSVAVLQTQYALAA